MMLKKSHCHCHFHTCRLSDQQSFYDGIEEYNETKISLALEEVEWTQEAIEDLQNAYTNDAWIRTCASSIDVSAQESIHESNMAHQYYQERISGARSVQPTFD